MKHLWRVIETFIPVVLLVILVLSPAYAQPSFNPPGLERAILAQENYTDKLLSFQGVVGSAVGLGAGGRPVVKIYTEKAGVAGLPRKLDGVPVVVQVTGKIFALRHSPGHGGGPSNKDNNQPIVAITSPAAGSSFSSGETIRFAGSADDAEDGNLTDSLTWTSSKDGPIGTGGSFFATLHDGIHTISASVNDSKGAFGSEEIKITVGTVVDPKSRFDRPIPIGVSSGSEKLIFSKGKFFCTVGTLGARVTDGTDVYALSNNHVYAQEGEGVVGIDRILQPGRVDMSSGCGTDEEINQAVIGTLYAFVPIEFSRNANNTVDAAIALSSTDNLDNETPPDGYGTPSSTIVNLATVGLAVQKYGRTTSLTKGTITGINATVIVRYDSGQARFVDQIVVEGKNGAFSNSGDSGSLIVTDDGKDPVALLFAGSSSITIGNPIDLVLDAFNVTIDGQF